LMARGRFPFEGIAVCSFPQNVATLRGPLMWFTWTPETC
jgi:hypothetical protein